MTTSTQFIYIVFACSGEWEDEQETPIFSCFDLEEAIQVAKTASCGLKAFLEFERENSCWVDDKMYYVLRIPLRRLCNPRSFMDPSIEKSKRVWVSFEYEPAKSEVEKQQALLKEKENKAVDEMVEKINKETIPNSIMKEQLLKLKRSHEHPVGSRPNDGHPLSQNDRSGKVASDEKHSNLKSQLSRGI